MFVHGSLTETRFFMIHVESETDVLLEASLLQIESSGAESIDPCEKTPFGRSEFIGKLATARISRLKSWQKNHDRQESQERTPSFQET